MKSLSVFAFILLLIGCTNDRIAQESNDLVELADMDQNFGTQEFPGKIPADHTIQSLQNSTSTSTSWQDYDQYYRTVLPSEIDQHYYDNLQWITLAGLVQSIDFSKAPTEVKMFYLDEVFSRNRINEPEVAVMLLEDPEVSSRLSEAHKGTYARSVFELNRSFFSNDNFAEHQANHNTAYSTLGRMGYTRHGVPR